MSSSEWREVKVSEIGKIVTGKTPKTAISENYGGNITFLTPSDDMRPGENAPVMHPHCKCSTSSYYDATELDRRLEELSKT